MILSMGKATKFIKRIFSRGRSSRQITYPEGTVDASLLREQLLQLKEDIDARFAADIRAYRATFLTGFYRYGYSPDFSLQNSADLYLLRQGAAYGLEYFLLYRVALNALLSEGITEAKSCVFGCGSMIDSLSMCFAADTFSERPGLSYTGVDPTEWTEQLDAPVDRSFVKKGLQDYWEDGRPFDGNILLFAKMFNEITEGSGDIESFCDGLRETEFTQDTVLLCSSFINRRVFQRNWQETDWIRIQKIIDALTEKGYAFRPFELPAELAADPDFVCDDVLSDDGTPYPYYYMKVKEDKIGIEEIAPDFRPPVELTEYMNMPGDIRRRCERYAGREKKYLRMHPELTPEETAAKTVCSECCSIVCKPEARTAYYNNSEMGFQVLMFKRN